MTEANVEGPLAALRTIVDELWDPQVGMVRLAPGVNPGVDLSAFDLHPIRETILGALLDLRDGRTDRALTAIRSVLAHQRQGSGTASTEPWSGTFKLTAEERPPPPDPVEWVHYDPNWRQFIGSVLACVLELHPGAIDAALTASMESAIELAVRSEPAGRIPVWYTNPRLMHAWLTAWVGARSGNPAQVAAGQAIAADVVRRVDKYGDVDEYNSPTYDGVDLYALALWQRFPPSPWFAEQGERISRIVGARVATLYHPGLGALCGPYIRAYGISLDRYVSLTGQFLALAGADVTRVLPPVLDARTDHVHDLWFLPLFEELSSVVVPHLQLREVTELRRHEQRFGSVVATSVLDAGCAMGAERGRVHEFARDQYVPFAAHFAAGGTTQSVGMFIPHATATADCEILEPREATIALMGRDDTTAMTLLVSEPPTVAGRVIELGRLRMELSAAPNGIEVRPVSTGSLVELRWAQHDVSATVQVRR